MKVSMQKEYNKSFMNQESTVQLVVGSVIPPRIVKFVHLHFSIQETR